jgi:ketosteroid isomerase-like protein
MPRAGRLAVIVTVGLLVGLVGAPAVNAQPDARAADERAIREADLAWSKAGEAKDLERLLSFFADGATELSPNAPMATGKEALRKVWSDYFASPGFAISWQPTKVEASRGGDLGYSIGTYLQTTRDAAGKPVIDRGKYVTIWKKQADGSWKVIADVFNSDLPAPPATR